MKKILIGMMALAAITFTASAQDKTGSKDKAKPATGFQHHKGHHQKHGRNMMMKDMNFSDAQKQQSKSVNEDFRNKMRELQKNDNMTVKDFKAQRESLMKERRSKMQALLTPEQKAKMEQNKKNMMAKRSQVHEKRMEKMKTRLNLTNDQVSKMNNQRASFKLKAEAIKNDQSLTRDQKKDQFMTLRKEQRENFKSILTPDQQKKLGDRKDKKPMKTT